MFSWFVAHESHVSVTRTVKGDAPAIQPYIAYGHAVSCQPSTVKRLLFLVVVVCFPNTSHNFIDYSLEELSTTSF